ncbi:MAG TPA: LCP family protein [Actinomycetota bacterium]
MSDDDTVQPEGHPHPTLRRAFLASTAVLSLFVLAAAAAAMGLYAWTESRIRYLPQATGSPGAGAEVDIGGPCARMACNYLLLGSDSRAGLSKEEQEFTGTNQDIGGLFRSDTIIVIHIEPDQKEAVFLSFPRDLWVDIPGRGENRINVAFEGGIEGGGAQLVARTITSITGLRINHVLYVDLAGFQGVVDALGGVEMCVPYPMQDALTGLDIPAGCQRFDGQTALAFVRTRHQPCDRIPDFARIGRQQQFLRAVIAKMLSPREIIRLPSLIPPVLDSLVMDEGLNPAELAYLAGQMNGVNTGDVDFRVVPSAPQGVYVGGRYLSVVQMVQPDAGELFRRLRDGRLLGNLGLTQEQTPPSPAIIRVGVYDRHSLGVAQTVYNMLTEGGFDTSLPIQDVSILGRLPTKGSVILPEANTAAGQAMAEVVRGYLSNLKVVVAPEGALQGVDVAVVIGPNYTLPPPSPAPPVSCQ